MQVFLFCPIASAAALLDEGRQLRKEQEDAYLGFFDIGTVRVIRQHECQRRCNVTPVSLYRARSRERCDFQRTEEGEPYE